MSDMYFAPVPGSESRPVRFEVRWDGIPMAFWTDAGVFSRGEIDRGSEILLKALPGDMKGPAVSSAAGHERHAGEIRDFDIGAARGITVFDGHFKGRCEKLVPLGGAYFPQVIDAVADPVKDGFSVRAGDGGHRRSAVHDCLAAAFVPAARCIS